MSLWDPRTGRKIRVLPTEDIVGVHGCDFSGDGRHVMVKAKYQDYPFRLDGGTDLPFADTGDRNFCLFSPDGALAATVSNWNEVELWDTRAMTRLHILPGRREVHRLDFSPDSRRLAVTLVRPWSYSKLWAWRSSSTFRSWVGDPKTSR